MPRGALVESEVHQISAVLSARYKVCIELSNRHPRARAEKPRV